MAQFFAFLKALGGLHDAIVQSFTWEPSAQKVEFRFEDIYSNFCGLPQYPGRQPAAIVLHGVTEMTMDVATQGRLRIFEFLPKEGTSDTVSVTFSPNGRIDLRFKDAEFPECRLIVQ